MMNKAIYKIIGLTFVMLVIPSVLGFVIPTRWLIDTGFTPRDELWSMIINSKIIELALGIIIGSFLAKYYGWNIKEISLNKISWKLFILSGLIVITVLLILFTFLFYSNSVTNVKLQSIESYNLWFIATIIVGSFSEEIYYRVILLNVALTELNRLQSIIIISVFFSLVHLLVPDTNLAYLLFTFVSSFILSVIYLRYRNILLNVFIHFLWNFALAIILGYRQELFFNESFLRIEHNPARPNLLFTTDSSYLFGFPLLIFIFTILFALLVLFDNKIRAIFQKK